MTRSTPRTPSDDQPAAVSQFVSTPSERFHTTPDTLTLTEWQRRHAATYGEANR